MIKLTNNKNNSLVKLRLGVFFIATLFVVMAFPKDIEAKALSTDTKEVVEQQQTTMISKVTSVKTLRSEFQDWIQRCNK